MAIYYSKCNILYMFACYVKTWYLNYLLIRYIGVWKRIKFPKSILVAGNYCTSSQGENVQRTMCVLCCCSIYIFQCGDFWVLGIWQSGQGNSSSQFYGWWEVSSAYLGSLNDQCFHPLASSSCYSGKNVILSYN